MKQGPIPERNAQITERELTVIMLRFGIGDENQEGWTQRQISQHLGVCRERARQIEERALQKLRQNPEIQKLKHLVEEA